MRRLLFLIVIPFVQTQIIDISVCADAGCSNQCLTWSASGGQCTPCSGVCSIDNPSSITTTTSLSLYSDTACINVIPEMYKIPIKLDDQCHPLAIGGSYKARNTTTVIWASVGAAFTLLIIIGCCIRMCWSRCCRKPEPDVKDYVVPYSAQIVPVQQQPYLVPSYTQHGMQNSYIVPYPKPVLIEPYKSGPDPYFQTPYIPYSSVPYIPGSVPYISAPYAPAPSAPYAPAPSAPAPSAPY